MQYYEGISTLEVPMILNQIRANELAAVVDSLENCWGWTIKHIDVSARYVTFHNANGTMAQYNWDGDALRIFYMGA